MFSKDKKSKKKKTATSAKKYGGFFAWLGTSEKTGKKSSTKKRKFKLKASNNSKDQAKELKSLNMRQELLAGEVKRQRDEIFEIRDHVDSLEDIITDIKSSKRNKQKDIPDGIKPDTAIKESGAGTADSGLSKALSSRLDDIILPPSSAPLRSRIDNIIDDDDELEMFSDTVVGELLHDAVRHNKLEVFAQPVVSLPQRKVIAFELLTRIRARAGLYLPAVRYIELAKDEDLIEILDNALLLNCLKFIKNSEGLEDSPPYFLNITDATLRDAGFMNALLSFLKDNRTMAKKIVFEMPQKEYNNLSDKLSQVVKGLAKIGCRFSMDQLTKPQIDMKLMRQHNIEFIKIHADHLVQLSESADGFKRLRNMIQGLELANIKLIVDYVEGEDQVRELLDFEIGYGQGYLFGKPEHEMTFKLSKKKFARSNS